MAKPFGVKHATAVLSKYRSKPPKDYGENQEFLDVLRRLPTEIEDDLVVTALVHDMKLHRVSESQANCLLTAIPARGVPPNPERWGRVVVRAMKQVGKDPDAAFYLAALPADEAEWCAYMVRMDDAHNALPGLWNSKRWTHEQRERVLRRLVADPAVVAGARAAARLAKPSFYDGWWWLLAADGAAESLPLVKAFVADAEKASDALDWLAYDLAPLMISPETAALRKRLMAAVEKRNKRAPGLAVARSLGIEADALRFKVGLYADGGMPRIRLWVDSSKDPWYDARWNWDELVHWPKVPASTSPTDELRSFLRSCVKDGEGRFRTWELATALRGDAKTRLVELLTSELTGLDGPKPASAPLKKFQG
jgi:hypothetical protein